MGGLPMQVLPPRAIGRGWGRWWGLVGAHGGWCAPANPSRVRCIYVANTSHYALLPHVAMFRHVFQPYIDDPLAHKAVLYYDETALIVRDAYPKSKFHYLVIPRLAEITHKHPFDVFTNNPILYDVIATYVEKAKDMIMEEMRLTQDFAPDNPMTNAEYRTRFIRAGVHAAPSLANFHIHVISQDFQSPSLKHKKHYNSFTTEFFVSYDDLEPHENNSFRDYGYASDSDASDISDTNDASDTEPKIRDLQILHKIIRDSPLVCTYCGVSFGSGFSRLKLHLAWEYAKHFQLRVTE